jgi:ribosomal-protein-alanine N-acetyltransferase
MPFQPDMTDHEGSGASAPRASTAATEVLPEAMAAIDWRLGLPVLASPRVTLRELRVGDAATLFAMLSTEETARFISPPPSTVEGFERFIEWTIRERERGAYFCFAVVPQGMSSAVGLFQLRALEPRFSTAEWGFVIGSGFWGTGLFLEGARLVLDFAFDCAGVHRLEARASVANGRGNGALRKVGAVQEGILRGAFLRNGEYTDQVLWSVLREDWHAQRAARSPLVH